MSSTFKRPKLFEIDLNWLKMLNWSWNFWMKLKTVDELSDNWPARAPGGPPWISNGWPLFSAQHRRPTGVWLAKRPDTRLVIGLDFGIVAAHLIKQLSAVDAIGCLRRQSHGASCLNSVIIKSGSCSVQALRLYMEENQQQIPENQCRIRSEPLLSQKNLNADYSSLNWEKLTCW